MRIQGLLMLGAFVLSLNHVPAQAAAKCPAFKPSTKNCALVYNQLLDYKAYVLQKFGNTKAVQKAIAAADKAFKKLCPKFSTNNYSPNSPYECQVVDTTETVGVSLGLDAASNLVNIPNPSKTVCMTSSACTDIVSQKFVIVNFFQTARCMDPNDQTVMHLTDAQVQTKVNAVP